MRVVVADTGPLHYLVLIGQVDLLPSLFVGVIVPAIVQSELQHPMAPPLVRAWAAKAPPWLKVSPVLPRDDPALHRLDDGENAAITLALTAKADLLLMDDRVGVAVARATGVPVIGTLGILDLAARRRLVDIAAAIAQLKATNFRVRPSLLDELLTRYKDTGEHGIT